MNNIKENYGIQTIVELLFQQHRHHNYSLLLNSIINRILLFICFVIIITTSEHNYIWFFMWFLASLLISFVWYANRFRLNQRIYELEKVITHKVSKLDSQEAAQLYIDSRYQATRRNLFINYARMEPLLWFLLICLLLAYKIFFIFI